VVPAGVEDVSAPDAIFDLAVNRAAAFVRGAGSSVRLEAWHARTRFASRVSLELIRNVLEMKPSEGEWYWSGGPAGSWFPGKARTP
jgi:hypothetical protein